MANSVDPDEMANHETSHQLLHCMLKVTVFVCRVERVKWNVFVIIFKDCVYIYHLLEYRKVDLLLALRLCLRLANLWQRINHVNFGKMVCDKTVRQYIF